MDFFRLNNRSEKYSFPIKKKLFRVRFLTKYLVDTFLPRKMDANEFREFGRASIDFIAEYLENIRDR